MKKKTAIADHLAIITIQTCSYNFLFILSYNDFFLINC